MRSTELGPFLPLAGQRQERPQHLHVLGTDRGDVDRRGDHAPGERRHDLLGALIAGAVGRLRRRGPQMRGDDDVRIALEQGIVGDRLRGEHIQRSAPHLARVERVLQRRVVDQPAAGDVEDAHAVAHLRERFGVQPVLRVRRLRQMDRDEVGLRVEHLAVLGLLHAQLAVALGAHKRVEGDHAHPERACPRRDKLADASEAEDPERLLIQLHAGELRALPLAARQRHVRLRNVAREREQQRHRVLSRRHHVRLRRVGHDDPALGGRRHLDIVDPHAGTPDHAQVGGSLDQLGGQLCGGANQDAVVGADPLDQLLVGPVEAEIDVEVLTQQIDAGVADLLLHQDLQPLAHTIFGRDTCRHRPIGQAAPGRTERSVLGPRARQDADPAPP